MVDIELSPAQRLALKSAIEHGSPTHHLFGSYAWGGWGATRAALQRRKYLDESCQITPEGRAAYAKVVGDGQR